MYVLNINQLEATFWIDAENETAEVAIYLGEKAAEACDFSDEIRFACPVLEALEDGAVTFEDHVDPIGDARHLWQVLKELYK